MRTKQMVTVPCQPMDGKLYYYERTGKVEALIPTPFRSNHACCMSECDNGNLICVWFAGSDEGNGDISVALSQFDAEKGVWSEAHQITSDEQRAEQNPALFRHPNGELWLVYPAQMSRQAMSGETFNLQYTAVVRKKVSKDNGNTWGPEEQMFPETGVFTRQPIQVLSNGRWILSTWLCFNDDTKNGSDITVFRISDDEGKNWHSVEVPDSHGCVHANVIELEEGKLLALFRSRSADYIYLSKSEDYGEHWTEPKPTELPNNNAGLSAIRLASGRIAVVYNEQSFNDDRNIIMWPFERSSVTIAVSEDQGKTWPSRRVVEPGEGFCGKGNLRSNFRYEYPYLFQAADGTLHICYSYHSRQCMKHVMVDENWIYGEHQRIEGDCKLWK